MVFGPPLKAGGQWFSISWRITSLNSLKAIERMTTLTMADMPKIGLLRTSNYDISNTCNLRCEGCLYFSGAGSEISRSELDIVAWREFFEREARRGINFAYLAGAEPSLTPARIRACHDHIPMGVIFTNGTKRIDPDIRYRIHVSVWGSDDRSALYRGADVNHKAMTNYAGDPRAVFVLTLSALNLHEIPEVARACADHGLCLTFSLFSPTTDYNQRMNGDESKQSQYFRFSSQTSDMRFDRDSLQRARNLILESSHAFPDTIRISPDYLDWVTQAESLYDLDDNGVARNCGNRLTHRHVHYNADLSRNQGKCCSPNLDCRDCRAYAMSLATYFTRRRQIAGEWTSVWRFWLDLFAPPGSQGASVVRATPNPRMLNAGLT